MRSFGEGRCKSDSRTGLTICQNGCKMQNQMWDDELKGVSEQCDKLLMWPKNERDGENLFQTVRSQVSLWGMWQGIKKWRNRGKSSTKDWKSWWPAGSECNILLRDNKREIQFNATNDLSEDVAWYSSKQPGTTCMCIICFTHLQRLCLMPLLYEMQEKDETLKDTIAGPWSLPQQLIMRQLQGNESENLMKSIFTVASLHELQEIQWI